MKVSDCMTRSVICVSPEESAEVAARLMARYNVGMLPVKRADGSVLGVVTDRDLVLRCMASGKAAHQVPVSRLMSNRVIGVTAEQNAASAAAQMADEQVRRLPVLEDGKLVGMLSLGDLSRHGSESTGKALNGICDSIRHME